jgi:hypothetical protein
MYPMPPLARPAWPFDASKNTATRRFRIANKSSPRGGFIGRPGAASFGEGLRFTLGNEELPGIIKEVRERHGVDLVVVLSHLGFSQDIKLRSGVTGVDVLR